MVELMCAMICYHFLTFHQIMFYVAAIHQILYIMYNDDNMCVVCHLKTFAIIKCLNNYYYSKNAVYAENFKFKNFAYVVLASSSIFKCMSFIFYSTPMYGCKYILIFYFQSIHFTYYYCYYVFCCISLSYVSIRFYAKSAQNNGVKLLDTKAF